MIDDSKVHPMFFGASQKLLWASINLNDLEHIVKNYSDLCVTMRFIPSISASEHNRLVVEARDLPFPRSPFIGDIVRNLRGSLDHATSAMLRAVEERDDNDYFPIHETPINFKDKVDKFLEKAKAIKLKDFFMRVDATKEGASKDIWYLNQIDRANKHRQLVVVEEVVVAPMPDMSGRSVLYHECWFELAPGQTIERRFPFWIKPGYSRPRSGSLKITFGPDEAIPGEDVIEVLKRFRETVLITLKGLQNEYITEYPDRANAEALRQAQAKTAANP